MFGYISPSSVGCFVACFYHPQQSPRHDVLLYNAIHSDPQSITVKTMIAEKSCQWQGKR